MNKTEEKRKRIGILKCPGSFDYGVMFSDMLGKDRFRCDIFDCEKELPVHVEIYDGFIITGSSASVYDDVEWVKKLVCKTRELILKKCRVVGICFGHQMVAQAFSKGVVTKNPNGYVSYSDIAPLEEHHTNATPHNRWELGTSHIRTSHRSNTTLKQHHNRPLFLHIRKRSRNISI